MTMHYDRRTRKKEHDRVAVRGPGGRATPCAARPPGPHHGPHGHTVMFAYYNCIARLTLARLLPFIISSRSTILARALWRGRAVAYRLSPHGYSGRTSATPRLASTSASTPTRPAAPAAADSHSRRGPWSTAPVRRPSARQMPRRATEPNSQGWRTEQAQAR